MALSPKDAFETYTQSANWGTDQSFQFFSGNPDQSPQGQAQSQHGSTSTDSNAFPFSPSNASGRS